MSPISTLVPRRVVLNLISSNYWIVSRPSVNHKVVHEYPVCSVPQSMADLPTAKFFYPGKHFVYVGVIFLVAY